MLRFAPILLALGYGIVMYRFSVWRTNRMLDAQSKPLNDPILNTHLAALARALDIPKIKVFLYEVDVINGLAAPDGRIFITRGFYKKFQNGDVTGQEIMSVIAHELGHVALGHSRRRSIDFAGQNAIRSAILLMLPGPLRMIGPYLVNLLMSLLAARLSRRDEFEADAYASALLIKSGIGTAPQISLFQKLDRLSGRQRQNAPAWLLSHPHSQQRIKAIESNDAKWS